MRRCRWGSSMSAVRRDECGDEGRSAERGSRHGDREWVSGRDVGNCDHDEAAERPDAGEQPR